MDRPTRRIPGGRGRGSSTWDCEKPRPGGARKGGQRPELPGGQGRGGGQCAGGMLARVECLGVPSLLLLHPPHPRPGILYWVRGCRNSALCPSLSRCKPRQGDGGPLGEGTGLLAAAPSPLSGSIHPRWVGWAPLGRSLGERPTGASIPAGPQR